MHDESFLHSKKLVRAAFIARYVGITPQQVHKLTRQFPEELAPITLPSTGSGKRQHVRYLWGKVKRFFGLEGTS